MIEAGLNVRCSFLLYIDILSRAFELDLLYVWTSVQSSLRYPLRACIHAVLGHKMLMLLVDVL